MKFLKAWATREGCPPMSRSQVAALWASTLAALITMVGIRSVCRTVLSIGFLRDGYGAISGALTEACEARMAAGARLREQLESFIGGLSTKDSLPDVEAHRGLIEATFDGFRKQAALDGLPNDFLGEALADYVMKNSSPENRQALAESLIGFLKTEGGAR